MGSYSIHWKESAKRDLRGIDRQQIPRIIDSVSTLSNDPYPKQHRKLLGSESSYRIRIGDYRVIYQVNVHDKIIFIYHVRHRKDVYRKM
ncbi:MAG: type II toxin-antitoxin system RelE/ParE family toxin [Bacteroidota bacterium]|nr:type II toxin-antitoxin system RelE/ParE family toxin [Bacteroidota bacterium]